MPLSLPAYLLTCLPAYPPTCLPAYLPILRVDDAKTNAVRIRIHRHLVAVRAAQLRDVMCDPRAAANHAQRPLGRPSRMTTVAGAIDIGAIPVSDPFPHVPGHVEQLE